MKPEIAYTIGLLGGDGTLSYSGYEVSITDECLEFHESILQPLFKKLFEKRVVLKKIITKKGNVSYRTKITSKEVFEFYKKLGIPTKDKTFVMRTPEAILNSPKNVIREYITGWMDAESWVTTKTTVRKK